MVIEQEDGFRVDFDHDNTATLLYLKKSAGWSRELADQVFEQLAHSYKCGLADAECELPHLDFEE